jgi:hypothetical protein
MKYTVEMGSGAMIYSETSVQPFLRGSEKETMDPGKQ